MSYKYRFKHNDYTYRVNLICINKINDCNKYMTIIYICIKVYISDVLCCVYVITDITILFYGRIVIPLL